MAIACNSNHLGFLHHDKNWNNGQNGTVAIRWGISLLYAAFLLA